MTSPVVMTNSEDTRSRYEIALLGEETSGLLSLRTQDIEPGFGTPLHIHEEQAETFHVVSGTFRFRTGDDEVEGGPGFTVHIPARVPHCFLYDCPTESPTGRLISMLTPGIHDGFILDVPRAEAQGMPGEELNALAAQNGAQIVGPKLTPTTQGHP